MERGIHSTIVAVWGKKEERHYPRWRNAKSGEWNSYTDHTTGKTLWFSSEDKAKQWLRELEHTLRGN
jgi:hypothetical protein